LKSVILIVEGTISDTLIKSEYIKVNQVPFASVESSDRCGGGVTDFNAVTDGDKIEFSFDGGLTIVSTDDSAPFSYSADITEGTSAQVWARAFNTITGCIGSWDSSSIAIAFKIPVPERIASENIGTFPDGLVDVVCSGEMHALYYVNGDPLATYNWRIPDLGLAFNDTMQFEVDWTVDGDDYLIELVKISSDGCISPTRDTLVRVSQPDPELGSDVFLCQGDSITYSFVDEYQTYKWQDQSENADYTARTTEKVYVRVMDRWDCFGSDTVMVTVNPNPQVDLGPDTVLCEDNSLLLDAGDYAFYVWSNGAAGNPITVREGAGIVGVTVTDENGCEAYDEIKIDDCSPANMLIIPNVFTPGDDPYHPTWHIDNINMFPDADIQVFDRWGRRVYQTYGGSGDEWDGKGPNGKDLPVDTYYYVIDLKVDGYGVITGAVSIIR
jgi:gliding motility-associated-like protein